MATGRRFCALGVCILSLAICVAASAGVIYQQNFDGPANPGWTTNDPANMYWDQANGRYHVMSWGGSNTYAFRSVPIQAGTSYRLEFDAYVTRMDASADVRFGFGDPDMTVDEPATLWTGYWSAGASIASVPTVGAPQGGTCCPFNLNTWYHHQMDWSQSDQLLTYALIERSTGNVVFTNTYPDLGIFLGMDRLYTSSIGDSTGAVGEGYIDNVRLTTYVIPEPASLVLLASGLAALARRRRRARP